MTCCSIKSGRGSEVPANTTQAVTLTKQPHGSRCRRLMQGRDQLGPGRPPPDTVPAGYVSETPVCTTTYTSG
eukprot:CAMPEP_0195125272 /NCGR_PEP_ID=MMETSP0448-20130528/132702_1 /TAXON_ID=66468 /ORGANISM="Heterocapsa triquestra, Strain CCMP 448" /LENGTH=71 /DNA_ID=CAMNT_0040162901 /DNA_START=117 /DNA_END=329 /DNA_ORIENTATION=+